MNNETYSFEQVNKAALEYFNGDTLAASVWVSKYALKSGENFVELSPVDTLNRISNELYRAELSFETTKFTLEEIKSYVSDFKYAIFGGSIMFGLGNNEQISSLGNCFFVDNGADSYGGIFNLDEIIGQLMKRRGGVGITIENLRPAKSKVNNSAQSSTGATSFMDRYSNTTREVAQDGRRGALMESCHVSHPDILDFIVKKENLTAVTGANVSLKVTDEFMRCVENNEDYMLHWPVQRFTPAINEALPYNKLVETPEGYVKRVKAKEIWNNLIRQAHKNAEPGVLFWDTIIDESPADCYSQFGFATKGTNPCGEVPLSSHDSCRLASVVLNELVTNPYKKNATVNFAKLAEVTRFLQRMMDNIVTLEEEKINTIIQKIKSDKEPEYLKRNELELWQKILEVLRNGRRTGLGVLGLGDMLAQLGIKYGSKEATVLIDEIFKVIAVSSYKESVQLAKERGCFPLWNLELEKDNAFIQRVIYANFTKEEIADFEKYGRRNIANLSIAPTGTLAIEKQTTSGIEPVFKIRSIRRKKINPNDANARIDFVDENGDSWQEYSIFHHGFLEWFINNLIDDPCDNLSAIEVLRLRSDNKISFNKQNLDGTYTRYIPDHITLVEYLNDMSEENLDKYINMSPWAGSESHSVDYLEKVNMQGVIQKWIDHAISVTHNVPEKITLGEVNDIYFQAWKSGCKGCTIYREGSRTGVLLTKKSEIEPVFAEHHAPKRPKEMLADYYYATSQGRKFAVIVGLYADKPYEIFAFENPTITENHRGKIIKVKKGEYKYISEKGEIERLELAADSLTERAHTILLSMLLRHGAPVKHIIEVATKIDDTITSFSSVCRRVLSKYVPAEVQEEKCPNCGAELVREEGCVHCTECSYSKC